MSRKQNYVLNQSIQRVIAQGLMMSWQSQPGSSAVDLVSEYSLETGRVRTRRLYRTYRCESAEAVTRMVLAAGGQVGNAPAEVFFPPAGREW